MQNMGLIKICFVLAFSVSGSELPADAEELYQKKYKKILSFLYAHPDMCVTVFIPGIILEWIETKHTEIASLCSELVERKQIEVLGGGYYEPLFPLLLPADRSAQIEALTTAVRQTTGKRPRGAFLTESIWDPSLISSFNTCGIEYALLDSRLVPQNEFRPVSTFTALTVEDMGKTVTIIPLHQDAVPRPGQPPAEYLRFAHNIAEAADDSVLACVLSPNDFTQLLENEWLVSFLNLLKNDDTVSLTVPQRYLKQHRTRLRTYIPAGCVSDAAVWAFEPFAAHERALTETVRPTVKDFLAVYPEAHRIYSRMMYVNLLISQCRGDKVRKKAAKEELHAAQNFASYMYNGRGGVSDKALRCQTYRHLLNAEKLVREAAGFKENSSAFDFGMAGCRDFLCCFERFNAFFGLTGGMLFELDITHSCTNYCTAARHSIQNGFAASYEKKMFIDHLWDDADFEHFTSEKPIENPVFACMEYKEVSFERAKTEIRLSAFGKWGKDGIPVSLKKNYLVSANGIVCQCILKNEGTVPLKAKFAVEHNVALPEADALNAEIVVCDQCEIPCTDRSFARQTGISLVRLTDSACETGFIFEPNELCGFYARPCYTLLHDSDGNAQKQYEAHTCAFYWEVDLLPGMETEKILNLTIKTPKKNTVAKKPKKR